MDVYVCAYVCICVCVCVCVYACAHIRVNIGICIYSYAVHIYMHAGMHFFTHRVCQDLPPDPSDCPDPDALLPASSEAPPPLGWEDGHRLQAPVGWQ